MCRVVVEGFELGVVVISFHWFPALWLWTLLVLVHYLLATWLVQLIS